jgi:hypothetical protein
MSWDQVSPLSVSKIAFAAALQDFARLVSVLTENLLNSLAYAELYLTLAALLRQFEIELFETTLDDVTYERDYFTGYPKDLNSQGVRVIINGRVA